MATQDNTSLRASHCEEERRGKLKQSAVLIPQLRFKEFDGEWKRKKLGDIGKVQMCKRIFSNQTTEIGDIPFFKIPYQSLVLYLTFCRHPLSHTRPLSSRKNLFCFAVQCSA